jgi:excisionase family DNA binding protein
MARPKNKTKPSARANRATTTMANPGGEQSPVRASGWPQVLTLAEAAAYLRVPDAELERIAGSQGLPGRRIGSEWRFSRAAIEDWLRWPSMKENLLRMAGSWKDDPYIDAMLDEIYRQRGRPMTEDGK